jgi:UDP-N-acetylmuramoyl-L-alanyl-D-glutamate--2,6-diaminopimelate ligase
MFIRKIKNIGHLFLTVIANIIYGFPANMIKVIGITGTDGKTTTTHLIFHVLKSSGKKVSMISSVYAKIGNIEYETGLHTTTPYSFTIQRLLRSAVNNGDLYFILETTAHGIDQNRAWGIPFYIGLITNISHEHIQSHKGYDYFKSLHVYSKVKASLLAHSEIALLNKDDWSYEYVHQLLKNKKIYIKTFGLNNKAKYMWKNTFKSSLVGDFQKYNILSAYAVCHNLGITDEQFTTALSTFVLPIGRFDVVETKPITVIIDFAHTVNGLDNFLSTVKKSYSKNHSLIHVFGSAGHRDYTKRSLMGETSAQWCDKVILTEEDYREEDPTEICRAIAKGLEKKGFKYVSSKDLPFSGNKTYSICIDREVAINCAILSAHKNDTVVITGKGHEKSLCRGRTEVPWDEKKIVLNALRNMKV